MHVVLDGPGAALHAAEVVNPTALPWQRVRMVSGHLQASWPPTGLVSCWS